MKKLKTLGIVTMAVLIIIIAAFAVLAALGVFRIEQGENGGFGEIVFTPFEDEKNREIIWQTSETEGDITAAVKTSFGEIVIKLGDCAAAEEFIKLDNEGAFEGAEFAVFAKDMFIQANASDRSFAAEANGYGCFYGSVGFVMDGEMASPSFFIITAKELSGLSSAYLAEQNFTEKRAELYESFGGIPEYEGKVIIFGQVISGMETAEKIASGENSGYIGGYAAAEPVKIESVEISYPTEAAE